MAKGNDMTLVGNCAHILLSPACQTIAFNWLGQYTSGKGYREVAFALLESRIRLFVKPLSDAGGKYSSDRDRMILGSPFNPKDLDDQMTLVHEATHAVHDIDYNGSFARWDIEAAAYVAEWIYFLNSNPTNQQWADRSTDPIDVLAMEIAGKIIFDRVRIESNLMNRLTDAIIADPLYHKQMLDHPFVVEDGIDDSDFP